MKRIPWVFVIFLIISFTACTAQPQPVVEPTVVPSEIPPKPTETLEPTATLEPTLTLEPTPTLVPFDLSVSIQDMNGNPVNLAEVNFAEVPESLKSTDETGQLNWTALPAESIQLVVQASGYKKFEKQFTLIRGQNNETVQLEDEPLGYKAMSACGPGEKLLYIEDMQDQMANNWPEIDAGAMGWSVIEKPDEPGNFVIAAAGNKDIQPPGTDLKSGMVFDNAVWRIEVWFEGNQMNSTFLNWRHSLDNGDQRYFPHIGPQVLTDMTRFNSGDGIMVGRSGSRVSLKKWANFEVSNFNGELQVWMNGKKMIVYSDKKLLPPGTIGLEPHFSADGKIYFDNLAVCELNAPFVSLPVPTPVKK